VSLTPFHFSDALESDFVTMGTSMVGSTTHHHQFRAVDA
jgi:hypothetical protein